MGAIHKIVVGITGASGAIYAQLLLKYLNNLPMAGYEVGVVLSDNAKEVWKYELESDFSTATFKNITFYSKTDFSAPFASGSAKYRTMIVCPCSMGTLGRIASGISNDLITRAADVMLKERGKLILVARDMPLSLIHINNMRTITEAGGIICPAVPSFYAKPKPKTIEEVAATVVNRVLDLADLPNDGFRWGSTN